MGDHRQPRLVGQAYGEGELVGGELGAQDVGVRREHPAAGHHLDDVDTALHPLLHGGRDAVLAFGGATEEEAVPFGHGQGRPGAHHARDAGRGAVTEGQCPVRPVPQVADRGHPGGRLPGQARGDDGIELVVGQAGGPLEAAERAVGHQVGVGVDQPGQQRAVVRRDLATVGRVVVRTLDARDAVAVHEEGDPAVEEPGAVEGAGGPDRAHGPVCGEPVRRARACRAVTRERSTSPRPSSDPAPLTAGSVDGLPSEGRAQGAIVMKMNAARITRWIPPIERLGAARDHRQHRHHDRGEQQHHVGLAEAELERAVEPDGGDGEGRDGEPDRGHRGAVGQVEADLQPAADRGADRRDRLRQQHQQCDHDADDGLREPERRDRPLDGGRLQLGQADDGDQRHERAAPGW